MPDRSHPNKIGLPEYLDVAAIAAKAKSLPPAIPIDTRPAIASAEGSFLLAGDFIAPLVNVDHGRELVAVPDYCNGPDLLRFMQDVLLTTKAQSVYFVYVSAQDNLFVLFMTDSVLHKLKCPIKCGTLGDWSVETFARAATSDH